MITSALAHEFVQDLVMLAVFSGLFMWQYSAGERARRR